MRITVSGDEYAAVTRAVLANEFDNARLFYLERYGVCEFSGGDLEHYTFTAFGWNDPEV